VLGEAGVHENTTGEREAATAKRVNGWSDRSSGLCVVPFGDDILYRMIYGLTEEEVKIAEGKA
jgi:hypothetical protein